MWEREERREQMNVNSLLRESLEGISYSNIQLKIVEFLTKLELKSGVMAD